MVSLATKIFIKLGIISLIYFPLTKKSHKFTFTIQRDLKAERQITKEIVREPRILPLWLGLEGKYAKHIQKIWPKNREEQLYYELDYEIFNEYYKFKVQYFKDQEVKFKNSRYYNVKKT